MEQYRIAGLTVEMETWGRTLRQAEPYRARYPGAAEIRITANAEALHQRAEHLSLDDCEYLSTGSSFYRQLIGFGGIMLHASAVMMDGWAYLFSADSGTGKSTHTGLWRQVFGADRVRILNDDKPALRREDGVWYAYGTPWSGKTDQNCNEKVPLGGICMLSRGMENRIVPFGGGAAAMGVLRQTVRPRGLEIREQLMDHVAALVTQVPVWKLECNMEPEAAMVSYRAMRRETK